MRDSFTLAVKSIWSNKMRSFLTMLGIIIGVASVIILVSLINGYMSYMTDSFSSLGTNQIQVYVQNMSTRFVTDSQMYGFYEEHGDYFTAMSPEVSVGGTVKNSYQTLDYTSVIGVGEDYADLKEYKMVAGRFISYADVKSRQKVAVVGYYDADKLYGSAQAALSQKIKINGYAYNIVGVIERQDEDSLDEGGNDDMVYIPYTSALKLSRNSLPSNYIFCLGDLDDCDAAVDALEAYLEEIFSTDSFYNVTAMSQMLDSLNDMINMMSLLIGGIAGISLLVAGVGVMNIMLVSVTERTREIGIRKALGARRGTIMQQFVIEASLTCVIAGFLGILIGGSMSTVIGSFMGISSPPTISAVLVSFGVSVAIGLIFGYMPADRAAKMNPIDALRSE